jgi:hypothetical protein
MLKLNKFLQSFTRQALKLWSRAVPKHIGILPGVTVLWVLMPNTIDDWGGQGNEKQENILYIGM